MNSVLFSRLVMNRLAIGSKPSSDETARRRKLNFPSFAIVVDFCDMFWCFEELCNLFVHVLYKLTE